MSLSELYRQKSRFEALKRNVQEIINELTNIINNMKNPIDNISTNFQIDNVSMPAEQLISIKIDLENKKAYLSSTVLNSINSEISDYQAKIEAELRALEQDKQEELRRLKKINKFNSD